MAKKIDKEKSVICSNWCDRVSLGAKGTFVDDFERPEDYFEGTLWSIRADEEKPFRSRHGNWYRYFVPKSTLVLEEEYKSFTDIEQLREEGLYIGNSFWIRYKNNTDFTHLVTITEITLNSKGSIVSIRLGTSVFTPEELLKNYEWSNKSPKDNDWRPFSIRQPF